MDNSAKLFRDKVARANRVNGGPRSRLPPTGVFNADGSPHPMNDFRVRAAQALPPVVEPVAGPAAVSQPAAYGAQPGAPLGARVAGLPPAPPAPTKIPVTMGAPGPSVAPAQVPPTPINTTMSSGPKGPLSAVYPGATSNPGGFVPEPAAPQAASAKPGLLSRAASAVERGIQPPDWKGLGSKAVGAVKAGAGGLLSNMNTIGNAVAAGDDLGAIWAAPNADTVSRLGASAEALGNTATGFLADRALRSAGMILPGLAGAVNMGMLNSRPVTALSRLVSPNGKSAIDNIRADNNLGESASPIRTLGNLAMSATGAPQQSQAAPGAIPGAKPVEPAKLSPELQAVKDSTFTAETDPFTRRADPAAELMRQQRNSASTADGGNGLGAAVDSAFRAQRGKFADGRSAFANDDTRALFNTNQALQGTGIEANKQANGVTEFSGNNVSGLGGKLYRAADGSITNDWSKTKDYADQIQRNAKDQDRLAELTRGAALTGDKEALARLTAGDGRLQAIAEKAGTERDLRQAVRGGSAKAATVLATMENNAADGAMKAQDLDLRRQALASESENRGLMRQIQMGNLQQSINSAKAQAARDERDHAVKLDENTYKKLEQLATIDGKVNPNKLGLLMHIRGQYERSPGESEAAYDAHMANASQLADYIESHQNAWDRWTRKGAGNGTVQRWKPNTGVFGGVEGPNGEWLTAGQYEKMPENLKPIFNKYFLGK